MALTTDEIELAMCHLGYQRNTGFTQNLGGPVGNELMFLAFTRLNAVLPGIAEAKVRQYLGYLESLDAQIFNASQLLAVDKVGEITIRQKQIQQLKSQYRNFAVKLAAVTGAPRNESGDVDFGRSMNVPVG